MPPEPRGPSYLAGSVSVVVPVFNEENSLTSIHAALLSTLISTGRPYEIVYVNDGSMDASLEMLLTLSDRDAAVRLVDLTRNYGKEVALSAGLRAATGEAVIMIDADGQHPVSLIPAMLAEWEAGAEVVVGVREGGSGQTILKRLTSWGYYRVLNGIAQNRTVPRSTDFRLLDREVVNAFNSFTERNRITRGLVDWLGYRRAYVNFRADVRAQGAASYSMRRLLRLAFDSFVSSSLLPLKLAGYLGSFIMLFSLLVAAFLTGERIAGDPLNLNISGTAFLALLTVFLVGVILSCLGLIALYIANIHTEVINRPLYVARGTPGGRSRTTTTSSAEPVPPQPRETAGRGRQP